MSMLEDSRRELGCDRDPSTFDPPPTRLLMLTSLSLVLTQMEMEPLVLRS